MEGGALVDSSHFVSPTVQETERAEKNNEDRAACFPGLGGDAPRFDHTPPIRLFQQATESTGPQTAARQYNPITMKYTSNSCKSPGLQRQKGFDKSAPRQATKCCPPNSQSEQRLRVARKHN